VKRQRPPADLHRKLRAGNGNKRLGVELQLRAQKGDLEDTGISVVADEKIRRAL
jgi:hypothetical protein